MIKPFPKPYPIQERLPERKQMTIAIGVMAHEGLVVAADSQESTGDYMKGTKGKIQCFYCPEGEPDTFRGRCISSCVIAGAGDSGYVQALTGRMGGVFLSNPKLPIQGMPEIAVAMPKALPKAETLNHKFEQCIKTFYKEHIIPFSPLPERKRPEVEMLFAVQRHNITAFFTTEKTVINPAFPCKAIGMGSTFAELFLGKLWRGMSVEQAEVLAAYIIFMTKESVESCGKYTTVVSIRRSKIVEGPSGGQMLPTTEASWLKREVIEGWESAFRKRWWNAEQGRVFSLIDEELLNQPPKPSTSRKSKGQR